ncbi:Uncharacterized protein M6B38_111865 [Iris pallida]|uniref:Uncharacterized protein n=1 Tax=Iris pallida TaxID=29817 RepID=A0AAX6DNA6_IRIPA|nr:Uncharacterized protein M6B38_111865 [Iris pallida]
MQRNAQSLLKKCLLLLSPSPCPPSKLTKAPPPRNLLPPRSAAPKFPSLHKPVRSFSGGGGEDPAREIDEINLKFAEAREEIESALESKETVYFDEEAECARDAVRAVLDRFDGLLARLPDKDKAALQRSMGLKIQQLKAELDQLNE